MLTTNSAWLLSSLVLGCNGLLSGSGSVIADLQARLFRAVEANDLAEARRLNDRIYPMARVFYADPFVDMHNRMKEALVLLGRLPRAVVRPPLVKLGRAEIERIREALVEAGLSPPRPPATPPSGPHLRCALPGSGAPLNKAEPHPLWHLGCAPGILPPCQPSDQNAPAIPPSSPSS